MRAIILTIALVLVPAPAYADHGGYRDDRDCESGNCNRREDSSYGQCRNFCPAFDKSPVQDSFNFAPQVCLPGATCYFEDRKKKEEPK